MSLADWWSRLTVTECAECGHPVPAFARVCPSCGVPNRTRRGALAIAAALGVTVVAALVAIVVVASWQRLPVQEGASPAAAGDFTWLTAAMNDCDALAEKEPDTLHFLVIPLAAAADDTANWQAKALNKVGNAILLRSDVALDGLKAGTLSISKEAYVLSVRDQAQVTYDWDRTVGVAKFSIPKSAAIESFNIQLQYGDKHDADWGNAFSRKKGNCYWVNIILAS